MKSFVRVFGALFWFGFVCLILINTETIAAKINFCSTREPGRKTTSRGTGKERVTSRHWALAVLQERAGQAAGSYSKHYRRGLLKLVQTLRFRSNNTMHLPIIDGIELVRRYEVGRRWGLVPLLDMLKEAALRGGWLEHFAPAGTRESMDRGELEMSVLCLHVLRDAMVHVNTLMLQDVLAEDEWSRLRAARTTAGSPR